MNKRKIKPTFPLCGEVLTGLREHDLKVTQRELAIVLGMNSQFVSNWERGLCMPPAHAMPHLLKAMAKHQRRLLKECLGVDLANKYWARYK